MYTLNSTRVRRSNEEAQQQQQFLPNASTAHRGDTGLGAVSNVGQSPQATGVGAGDGFSIPAPRSAAAAAVGVTASGPLFTAARDMGVTLPLPRSAGVSSPQNLLSSSDVIGQRTFVQPFAGVQVQQEGLARPDISSVRLSAQQQRIQAELVEEKKRVQRELFEQQRLLEQQQRYTAIHLTTRTERPAQPDANQASPFLLGVDGVVGAQPLEVPSRGPMVGKEAQRAYQVTTSLSAGNQGFCGVAVSSVPQQRQQEGRMDGAGLAPEPSAQQLMMRNSLISQQSMAPQTVTGQPQKAIKGSVLHFTKGGAGGNSVLAQVAQYQQVMGLSEVPQPPAPSTSQWQQPVQESWIHYDANIPQPRPQHHNKWQQRSQRQSDQQGSVHQGQQQGRNFHHQKEQPNLQPQDMRRDHQERGGRRGGKGSGTTGHRGGKDSVRGPDQRRDAGERPQHPVSSKSDDVVLSEFKRLYALQERDDEALEHLRVQVSGAGGVVGTLDVARCREMIANHDVTIVVTDTGTGKSTLIPKAILDDDENARVVNTQPRRTPAIKLAQRVASLYNERVGERVGYWVRGEHVGTVGTTPIMYVTNYTLFLHLLHTPPEKFGLTHVIFDEFHERTVEVEVLLLMVKLVMKRNKGCLKLVLCSATVEASKWVSFFDGLTVAEYCKADSMYPIHDYYLEDVSKLIGVSYVKPSMHPTGVVKSLQLHTIILYIKELLRFLASTVVPEHSILVFVPGRTVVEQLCLWIRDNLGDQLDPIPWYRDIELSFIQEALERESVTKKKVYVATDIAEVSLTLPDVVFVIDSGTLKRPHIVESNPNSVAFPPLELLWETSVNLTQRRGRIGRVQQGFFFTMLSRDQVPELPSNDSRLSNAVIHSIVLHCLHLTSVPFVMFSMCPQEPRRVSVDLSLSILRDGGYIVQEDDEDSLIERIDNETHIRVQEAWSDLIISAYKAMIESDASQQTPPQRQMPSQLAQIRYHVTMRGLIVGRLPLGVGPGTIVFNGLITGLTTLSIIAASCVSCSSPFYVPYNVTGKVERLQFLQRVEGVMRQYKGEFLNDAVSATGAVIAYLAMQREGLSEDAQSAWCEKRYLSRSRIIDILQVVNHTKEQLSTVIPFEDVTDVDELMEQLDNQALTLSTICSAAHMYHGIYVLHDVETAQKERFAGSGVFVTINCCRDQSVPTTCPWERDTVCIPFALQTIYDRLVGSFSSQLRPEVYNAVLLMFSSRILYEEIVDDIGGVTFEVTQCGSCVYINCDNVTALQLLQLRRLMCARQCTLHMLLQGEAGPTDTDLMANLLRERDSDFGIPEGLKEQPQLLPAMIASTLAKLVQSIGEASISNCRGERNGKNTFCKAVARPPKFSPVRQSVLVNTNNGCAAYERPRDPLLKSVHSEAPLA
uniref:Putative helicase n=1 Tax=Trypanosoma congolense (strain IL3000) TaxID=1068625 RepID=G0UUW2_TRYCI|nr:putative helicase [Trypanosoma congolense IL3000]